VALSVAGRHAVRLDLSDGGWKDVRVLGHPDGCALTAFFRLEPLPYGAPSAYSPEAFAEDMAVFVRRLLPRAAVTAVAAHPARAYPGDDQRAAGLKYGPNPVIKTDTIQRIRNVRRVVWAAVTFHLQDRDLPPPGGHAPPGRRSRRPRAQCRSFPLSTCGEGARG